MMMANSLTYKIHMWAYITHDIHLDYHQIYSFHLNDFSELSLAYNQYVWAELITTQTHEKRL